MKIFHISDVHLNEAFLSDWKRYMRDAFVDYVNRTKGPDSIIVCTGDLIDKGGQDWGSAEKGFSTFEKEFINPILDTTGITKDRFVLCPGNHDIERDKDPLHVRVGIRNVVKSDRHAAINKYSKDILEGKPDISNRINSYYEFVKSLYEGCDNVIVSKLGVAFIYDCEGKKVGVAAFNSVWNSYDDKDYDEGLAIGEPQYEALDDYLGECASTIAAIHHPLDWFPYENRTVVPWITNNFDIILLGHIHKNDTCMAIKPTGTYAYNISPCFSSDIRGESKTFVNGFTEIDFSTESKDVKCTYLVFNLGKRVYELNSEYADEGVFEFCCKNNNSSLQGLINRCIDTVKNDFIPRINSNLIPQRAKVISSLDEAFVMPPLRRNGDDSKSDYPISTLINSKSNIVLFGSGESGKTTLLHKCMSEFVRDSSIYQLVPVFLDFSESTNQDFETIIKNFLSINTNEANKLISEGRIVLLIDNYSVSIEYKNRKSALYKFLSNNAVRIIATVDSPLSDTIPASFVKNNDIPVEAFFIQQFDASKVKELMEKWTPEDNTMQRINKIENMVDKFCNYSLPCTAMSVSMYLWCTEDDSRAPINSAFLLDIYLDNILEKLAIDDVYRDSFNYNNKCNLLAYIAYICNGHLINNSGFSLTKGKLISITEDYLDAVGYKQFQADKLVDYFIKQRIFVQDGNTIRYSHSCFFYFFLAKRMIANKDFKDEVMSKDNYYKYERVLDYYSGLVLSDKEWLIELHRRFEEYFSNWRIPIDHFDVDTFFTRIVEGEDQRRFVPIAEKINPTKVVYSKPTVQDIERRTLAVSNKRLEKIEDKIDSNEVLSMSNLLVMMSKALRNLEGVEDTKLKQEVYDSIIRNALVYFIWLKDYLAYYANNNNGELPPSLSDIKDVYSFFRFLPYISQFTLYSILGTPKLQVMYETKLKDDIKENRSDVEKYLSLAMMWDCANVRYYKEYRRMIRNVGNNSVQDYLLLKLLYYFNNKVVLGSASEKQYIDLIAEAKVKAKLFSRIKKGALVLQMEKDRQQLIKDRKKSN